MFQCFQGNSLTGTSHNILTKPQATFPENYCFQQVSFMCTLKDILPSYKQLNYTNTVETLISRKIGMKERFFFLNSLPHDKILDYSKLKAFADDKIKAIKD